MIRMRLRCSFHIYTSQAETDLLTDINGNKVPMTGLQGALSTNSPKRTQAHVGVREGFLKEMFMLRPKDLTSPLNTAHAPHSQRCQAFSPLARIVLCSTCLGCSLRFPATQSNSDSTFTFQLKSKAMAATLSKGALSQFLL